MIKLKLLAIALISLQFTACIDTEKNKLENRATAYWDYKVKKDFKKAYEFLTPGWKKTESMQSYERRFLNSKVNWTKSAFNNKKCSKPDLCRVTMAINYEFMFKSASNKLMKMDDFITDTWVLKDNIWYVLPIKKNIKEK